MKKIRLIMNLAVFCLVIGVLSAAFVLLPDSKVSASERRTLTMLEDVAEAENPFDEVEGYFLDQFPMRDTFRTVKAVLNSVFFMRNDNNGLYVEDGSVVKTEDILDEKQVEYASDIFAEVTEKYFPDNKVYYSVIPDKHYYASAQNGYPALDYEKMFEILDGSMTDAQYIDIKELLSLSDFYKTDSHWSQEKIIDVADTLLLAMNKEALPLSEKEITVSALQDFYGVYYGQSALALDSEELKYIVTPETENMTMYIVGDDMKLEEAPLYSAEYFENNVDPYDFFSAGAQEIVVIENNAAENDRELVVFRDSFGSSMAPLLAHGYKKITLVDLRYIEPGYIPEYVELSDDSDVLFLYSTGMLNSGAVTKRRFDVVPLNLGIVNNGSEDTPQTSDEIAVSDTMSVVNGYAVETKKLDKNQIDYAVKVINNVKNRLLGENKVYLSVIPDKNYYASMNAGRDMTYYDALISTVKDGVSEAQYIDITQTLSLEEYYKTDTHWSQENIVDTANTLVSAMNDGVSPMSDSDFEVMTMQDFAGSQFKAAQEYLSKEDLKYLVNGEMQALTATCINNMGKTVPLDVYSKENFNNVEQYDFFLGGAQMLVTIENPNAESDKTLVVFRDSFGSSIAPLLAHGYKKVVCVDLRYIVPDLLQNFVDFTNCDVLFLYSTDILNGGRILKDFMR